MGRQRFAMPWSGSCPRRFDPYRLHDEDFTVRQAGNCPGIPNSSHERAPSQWMGASCQRLPVWRGESDRLNHCGTTPAGNWTGTRRVDRGTHTGPSAYSCVRCAHMWGQ